AVARVEPQDPVLLLGVLDVEPPGVVVLRDLEVDGHPVVLEPLVEPGEDEGARGPRVPDPGRQPGRGRRLRPLLAPAPGAPAAPASRISAASRAVAAACARSSSPPWVSPWGCQCASPRLDGTPNSAITTGRPAWCRTRSRR